MQKAPTYFCYVPNIPEGDLHYQSSQARGREFEELKVKAGGRAGCVRLLSGELAQEASLSFLSLSLLCFVHPPSVGWCPGTPYPLHTRASWNSWGSFQEAAWLLLGKL